MCSTARFAVLQISEHSVTTEYVHLLGRGFYQHRQGPDGFAKDDVRCHAGPELVALQAIAGYLGAVN